MVGSGLPPGGTGKPGAKGNAGAGVTVRFPKFEAGKLITDRTAYVRETASAPNAYGGKVLYSDESKDLALVQLSELPKEVQAIPLAQPARAGQAVHSLGNPSASDSLWIYTSGTVRANPYAKEWISGSGVAMMKHSAAVLETQSPTNPGDSGGPLVNERSELVAITHGSITKANSVNLFIDVSEVKTILSKQGYRWREGNQGPGSPSRALAHDDVFKLAGLLQHASATVRTRAATYLGEGGAGSAPAVDPLVKALGDPAPEARRAAARALGQIGPKAASALPGLTAALKAADAELRRQALRAITAIGPRGGKLALALTEILRDDADLRPAALAALARLGPDAQPALPAIGAILEGNDAKLRLLAFDVLDQVGPAAGQLLPQLKKCLVNSDRATEDRVLRIANALNKGDEVFSALLPEFIEGLRDSDTNVCLAKLRAIKSLGQHARAAALPVAKTYGASKDRKVRVEALRTLAAMRENAEEALPTLLRDFKDTAMHKADRVVYDRLKDTLVKIGRLAVAPLLKMPTKDSVALNRYHALQVIAAMGPDVKDLVMEPLKKIQKRDTSVSVRSEAEAVLKRLAD